MAEILEQIKNIEVLRENLAQTSCVTKDAFMKLSDGKAPTLDYNLPQNSTFTTYGHIQLDVDESAFIERATEIGQCGKDQYFKLSTSTLRQQFNRSMQLNSNDMGIGLRATAVRKQLDIAAGQKLIDVSLQTEKDLANTSNPQLVMGETCLNDAQVADLASVGYRPFVVNKLNGSGSRLEYLKRPEVVKPRLFIIEEYKTSSFLGNYGAGKTLQTFSLLPGEKTTLTIRTYKDSSTTKSQSENLLDSFSQDSVDEMENLMEEENNSSSTESTSKSASVSASVSGVIKKIINIGVSASASKNTTASRSANSRALNRALSKHVEQSNSSRNIEINTSSTETVNEGEEYSTVREIENINKSRVLNFVFRQLLQEYVSITYLSNIRIAYTDGLLESTRIVDIEEIDELLSDVIESKSIDNVKNSILQKYQYVLNYKKELMPLLQQMPGEEFYKNIKGEVDIESFWTCKPEGETYRVGNMDVNIPGIILQVQSNILRTDSLVADALLGQGEALDCFNMRAQDAVAIGENLKNLELMQKIEIIEGLDDPQAKADAYKSVFFQYCDNPQTQIISNTTNS